MNKGEIKKTDEINKREPQNCWEFFGCEHKEECPAYKTDSGRECWFVSGSMCPKIKNKMIDGAKIEHCWDCPWYKKLNLQI